jgi:probable HAF family extracellular repeat protein
MTPSRLTPLLFAAALASFTVVLPARSALLYDLTPLDPPPGYTDFTPNAINTPGQVVGTAMDADTSTAMAVVWRQGSPTALGTLGGWRSNGTAVNDAGLVVGESSTALGENEVHAFVWDGNTMQDLGVDGRDSGATGINSAATIVGYERDRLGNAHAMLWEQGVGHRLDRFDLGFSSAVAVNNSGQVVVVAYASGAGGSPDSYISDGGALTWLGVFQGTALNASANVIGYRSTPLPEVEAILWQEGQARTLADSQHWLLPVGINARGQVVGSTLTPSGAEHAALWEDGLETDLNDAVTPGSGWELWRASAINDAGQIVGFGTLNGTQQAFMLTPD